MRPTIKDRQKPCPDTREAVTALIGHDPDALIHAEHDGEFIGSIVAGWDGWRCHLYRLAVRPGGPVTAGQVAMGYVLILML
jgi:hypothetical protein